MKKVTIELDDAYGEVLSITASGRSGMTLNVATSAVNLQTTDTVKIDEKGKVWCGCENKQR